MIDLHCHLLPAIDDGPRDMDGALALARQQVLAGVSIVAATPHVSWDMPTEIAAIDDALVVMRETLAAAQIPLEVVRGAEVDVVKAQEMSDEQLGALALGGGRWLLVEAPLQLGLPLEPVALELMDRGHGILLAHPERSPLLQREPAQLRRLVEAGALTQVTAGSLVGRFGRTVQRYAEHLLDEGLVHTIASDAHDAVRRAPGLTAELVAAGAGELLPVLVQEVPAAILGGTEIPVVPRHQRRRHGSLRGLLKR